MNTKAIVSAIEHAMERTVNYPSLIEKIAYLDGLAAACEYPHPGHPMMALEVQWKRIKGCREVFVQEIEAHEAERVRLLTTFPNAIEEESVFDAVPEESKAEFENPLAASDEYQAIDRARREQIEPIVYEPTPKDLDKIMQEKVNAAKVAQVPDLVTPTKESPYEALGKAMFGEADVSKVEDLT